MGPFAIPAIAKGAAALSAALGLTAIVASREEENELPYISLPSVTATSHNIPLITAALMAKAKMLQSQNTNIPTAENALVLRPEYRTITPVEYIGYKPLWMDETVSEEDPITIGDTQVIEDDYEVSPHGNSNNSNNQNDDENWLDKYRRKRREHLREKRDIQADEQAYARGRLRAEQERLRISRERIAEDKAYQEFLRSQGRSIPRPSVKSRPLSQGISRFFGGKGPATTNRFYNSPAMGTLEWIGVLGGGGLGGYYGGKALGWWGEDSNNSSNEIDREGTEQAWKDMKVGRKPGQ